MSTIIGLAGRKGSGKDTVADMIYRLSLEEGDESFSIAFADPVKEVCRTAFRIEHKWFRDRELKSTVHPKWGITPREMMQKVGTDMFRSFDPNIWIKYVQHELMFHYGKVKFLVVSDVRFENEADMVRNLGGKIWHIQGRGEDGVGDSHSSEAGVSILEGDHVILNDGTLADLHATTRSKLYGEHWTTDRGRS